MGSISGENCRRGPLKGLFIPPNENFAGAADIPCRETRKTSKDMYHAQVEAANVCIMVRTANPSLINVKLNHRVRV
jgi:hypothetical protein